MPRELKSEDVMKALECCITQCQDCYKCPMQKEKHRIGSKDCYAIVKQKALALLREKNAEITRLKGLHDEIEQVRLEYLEGRYTEADLVVQLYLIRKKYEEGKQ